MTNHPGCRLALSRESYCAERVSSRTLAKMTTDGGGETTERERRGGRGTKSPRTAEEVDRVARLRDLHNQAGTAGLVAYCQRRLEQSLPAQQ